MRVKTKPKQLEILRTKKGCPVLWENFSTYDTMQKTTTVISHSGKSKRAIIQKSKNNLTDSLVPIRIGDYIVKAFSDHEGVGLSILVVEDIDIYCNEATVRLIIRKNPDDDQIYADDDYIDAYVKVLEPEVKNCLAKLIKFTNQDDEIETETEQEKKQEVTNE